MRRVGVVLGLLIAGGMLLAGTSELTQTLPSSPEDAIQQYFDSLRAGKWERLSTLIHPDAIERKYIRDRDALDNGKDYVLKKYGLEAKEQFLELTPDEAFARMLDAETPLDLLEARRLAEMDVEIVGSVEDGDLVYVVFRIEHESMSNVGVLTCKKRGDVWLIDRL